MCSIDGCGGKLRAKGFCYKHYMKLYRYGDPLYQAPPTYIDIAGQTFGRLIVLERRGSKWLCLCDCGTEALVAAGDLNRGTTTSCGDRKHRRVDGIGYHTAHDRVRTDRGRANAFSCGCGQPAAHWSYQHSDPNELVDERGIAYSPRPEFYEPMCVPCHKRADLDRKAFSTKGSS